MNSHDSQSRFETTCASRHVGETRSENPGVDPRVPGQGAKFTRHMCVE